MSLVSSVGSLTDCVTSAVQKTVYAYKRHLQEASTSIEKCWDGLQYMGRESYRSSFEISNCMKFGNKHLQLFFVEGVSKAAPNHCWNRVSHCGMV